MNALEHETQAFRAAGSAVVKSVALISLTVWLCFWVSSCSVSAEMIQECKSACSTSTSQLDSVTSRECRCSKTDLMVIPSRSSATP